MHPAPTSFFFIVKNLPVPKIYFIFVAINTLKAIKNNSPIEAILLGILNIYKMKNQAVMTDEELALSYVNGDNRAFDELLLRNQSKIFSYILFVVRDRDTADDVFQETFVKVVVKLQQGKYVPSGKFSAWVLRIAHNVIMDLYRGQKSQKIIDAVDDNDLSNIAGNDLIIGNVESQFVNTQVMSDVRKMMNLLPTTQREVVYMRYFQQMSFKEIADTTNVSINTSLGRMRYAILNLRRMAREHNVVLQLV